MRSFSYRPAILYPRGCWIINGERRTNNQERVLGSHCLKFTVFHNIEHVQFTCQQLSDSHSRVPFSYFDLIQHLAGWWSMAEDGDRLFIPLNFGIWLRSHASYVFIYRRSVLAGYRFPVEPRLAREKEIEKSGFSSSLKCSVHLLSWVGLDDLLISFVRENGMKNTPSTHYLKGDTRASLPVDRIF